MVLEFPVGLFSTQCMTQHSLVHAKDMVCYVGHLALVRQSYLLVPEKCSGENMGSGSLFQTFP